MNRDKNQPLGIGWPEWITGLVMWLIVGVLIFTSDYMPFWMEGAPGPRLMPVILAVCLGLLTVAYWIKAYQNGSERVEFPGLATLKKPAIFIALSFLMYFSWDIVGAVPTILLVGFLELKIVEEHPWPRSFLVAFVMCVAAFVVFQLILDIPLPRGWIISMLI